MSVWKGSFSLVYNEESRRIAKQATELLGVVTNFYISRKPCWLGDLDIESAISQAQSLRLVDTQSVMSKFESAVAQGTTSAHGTATQIVEVLRILCSSLDSIQMRATNTDDIHQKSLVKPPLILINRRLQDIVMLVIESSPF